MFRPAIRRALLPIPTQKPPVRILKNYLATPASRDSAVSPNLFGDENPEQQSTQATKAGALRPHLGIEVKGDHGLFAFFRKVEDENSVHNYKFLTVEDTHSDIHESSRSWTTAELRRKSFRDLHIIWYLCRRELNLLATQKAELKRIHRLASIANTPITLRAKMCRKTCARIKFVLNERRLALIDATSRIRYSHRPGYKDPARNPRKMKLKRGPKLTEKEMKRRMQKLSARQKLRFIHPELRKRPIMMLKWASRRGEARPIKPLSDIVATRSA